MDKYTLLILLNLPFIIIGISSAIISFKLKKTTLPRTIFKLIFWLTIAAGVFFAEEIYEFLVNQSLTDSTPLSIMDVVLITACNFLLYQVVHLHNKVDTLEYTLTKFHEKQTIINSSNDK